MLRARPSFSEIIWNFSRYQERARLTLEQNPHFYSRLPEDESAYTPVFKCQPLRDFSTSLKPNDTVYVLVDRPSHVFLETVTEKRSFGNIWMLNGSTIFKGWRLVSSSLCLLCDVFQIALECLRENSSSEL